MCRDIRFGVCLDSLSKDRRIISNDVEKNILELVENNPNLFISFEDLGINPDDVNNPEFYEEVYDEYEIGDIIEFSQDIKLKVINLYRYVSDDYGSTNIGSNSRPFCVELSKRSNVSMLTYQSIIQLNSSNPGFVPEGANTYSIFDWRGGPRCKHYWVKYFYDTETRNLVKAPGGEQPTQKGKGNVPNLPQNKRKRNR